MSASLPPRDHSSRRRLPVQPSEENLRKQAKRRAKLDGIQLAEAQHRLATEYGCRNWAELMHVVKTMNRGAAHLAGPSTTPQEALPAAVNQNDLAAVQAILDSGTFTQHDLDLALARSVLTFKDWAEIARLLIEHGADPDGQYGANYGPIVFVTGESLDIDGLQFLIDHGADVSFPPVATKYGNQCPLSTWLGTYVRGRNEQKHRGIELLLKHGAIVPAEIIPPMLAIHRGDASLLGRLLDQDPSLLTQRFTNMPYGNIALAGGTLLHCAVEFGELECIEQLFQRHADINIKADVIDGVGGQTPVFHVINTYWASQFQTLEYLVQRVGQWIDLSVRASFRWHGTPHGPVTPIEFSGGPGQTWGRNNVDAERALLRSLDLRATIRSACERGDVSEVMRLLGETPSLLTGDLWPATVHVAQSLPLAQLLLERGLDPNVSSAPRRAIDLAAYHALADIAELLLAHGANVTESNALGERPLDLLDAYEPRPVGDPNTQRIRAALIQAGATDNIHSASRAGDIEGVRRMLDSDPSLRDTQSPWPPLFSAARSGRPAIVELLIDRGANINARNDAGNSPLWFACQSAANAQTRIEVARRLIDAGARVRELCEDHSTALHFAAWRGPLEMVELLLRAGAKEWQGDKNGKTALDYARRGVATDQAAIIELLNRPVIRDPVFKQAVVTIQAGDLSTLQQLLAAHPNLTRDRAIEPNCYPPSYFGNPKLLWFVANNPSLIKTMPANSVEIAEAIIDAGAEQSDLDYTLGLVMTSSPAREQHLQRPLMKLLLDRGATANATELLGTLGHGEQDAIVELLTAGMRLSAPLAAGLGLVEALPALLVNATEVEKHAALSMAVINKQIDAARLCLDAGADVNAFLVVHTHSTPAHQAAVNDDVAMLRLLVDRGADLARRDTLWNGTPLGWAIHTAKPAAEAFLRSVAPPG